MIKYCITKWGAILKVASVKNGLVDVSDPDAVDAGMFISTREVDTYWLGYRPKDKLPEEYSCVSVVTHGRCMFDDTFEDGDFEYNRKCKEGSEMGGGSPDYVILWGKPDFPY